MNGRELVPLEFSIAQRDIDWQMPSVQQFLTEFSKLLVTHNAENILGLCTYQGDGYPGRVEFTVGRSNINLTPDEVRLPSSSDITKSVSDANHVYQAERLPSTSTREAAWFYTDDFIRRAAGVTALIRRSMTTLTGIPFRLSGKMEEGWACPDRVGPRSIP